MKSGQHIFNRKKKKEEGEYYSEEQIKKYWVGRVAARAYSIFLIEP